MSGNLLFCFAGEEAEAEPLFLFVCWLNLSSNFVISREFLPQEILLPSAFFFTSLNVMHCC